MALLSPQRASTRPRLVPISELTSAAAGTITVRALVDHRVAVHVGSPTRGQCHLGPFVSTAGEVDLIPAGASDECVTQDSMTRLIVRFPPALLSQVAQDAGVDPARAGIEPRHQIRDASIEHIAWAIDLERAHDYPNGSLYSESLGVALALHLLGKHATPRLAARGLSRPRLQRVTDYIEAHLSSELSLAQLADVAGSSVSNFKTSFREAAGLPVHRYVVQRRVERARALLRDTDLPISQVAFEVGFAHASHLAKWMRRELGITPSSLRR